MQSVLSLSEEMFLQKLAVEKKRAQSLASPHADLASPAQSRRSSLCRHCAVVLHFKLVQMSCGQKTNHTSQ